jgi:hypothetical protein
VFGGQSVIKGYLECKKKKKKKEMYIILGTLKKCRPAFVTVKIMTLFSKHIYETILHNRKNCNLKVNNDIYSHNTRNKYNYYINRYRLESSSTDFLQSPSE